MPESPLRKRLLLVGLLLLAGGGGSAQAADTGSLAVSAVVPSKNNCKFSSAAMALDFGTVNPASTVDATATVSTGFTCNGSAPLVTFVISAGDGLYSTGPGARRMRHATIATEFMAYSLALSPSSATVPKGSAQTLTVTGTIHPFQFQDVPAGTYQDTVVITLTP